MRWLDPKKDWMARMEAVRDVAPWLVRFTELALFLPFHHVQRIKGYEIAHQPHFDDESTEYFISRLKAARSYLEYGSGGTTLLAAEEGITVTSVESDPRFLEAVRSAITAGNPEKRRLIYADIGSTQAWGIPVLRTKAPRRREMWRNYCASPWRDWPADIPLPDLVLIDGRFRVASALSTIRALSSNASRDWELLVDDYAGRAFYEEIEQFARLVKMVGRMAVFAPLDAVDMDRLNERLEVYSVDWR